MNNKRLRRIVTAAAASIAMAGVGVVLTVGVVSTATLVAMALPKPLCPWSRVRKGAA